MRRAAVLPLLSLLLVALASPALASSHAPPPGAQTVGSTFTLASWVGERDRAEENGTEAGAEATLWLAARDPYAAGVNRTEGVRARYVLVNLTAEGLAFANATVRLALPPAEGAEWTFGSTTFAAPANATGPVPYAYEAGYFEETANGTTLVASLNGVGAVEVLAALPPTPPAGPGAIPTTWLVGGGAVLVVGGGAALYAMRRRRERELMNAAPRRSQVMREMELERELRKAEEKEPERAAEIKQEIRAQEQVREKRRELQILEAKRADVLKTMDLLQKRHESGGLTRLQYDNMVKKKRADLERIEAEIAQMEAEDAAAGGAAA